MTQQVMLQSFIDEFELPDGPVPNTPAQNQKNACLMQNSLIRFWQGKTTTQHDVLVSSQNFELGKRIIKLHAGSVYGSSEGHVQGHEVLYQKSERSLLLKPDCEWDGNPSFEFVITGQSDSDYAKDTDTHKSISGTSTFLNGSLINTRNMTEAELVRQHSVHRIFCLTCMSSNPWDLR
jgi:hypothetical protein